MNRLILALLVSATSIVPAFAQSLEPSDLPPIQLNQNNARGGVTGVLGPANGGSGASSSLSNGQLLIGHTGNSPVAANLTAGANISVTNGAGTITVAATGVATSGANSNVTSLSGLTTPLSAAQGGTGSALFSSGQATFVSAGSIAVADASITSSSIVVVSQSGSSAVAEQFSVSLTPSTGFTVHSSNSSSTAVVNYIRVK